MGSNSKASKNSNNDKKVFVCLILESWTQRFFLSTRYQVSSTRPLVQQQIEFMARNHEHYRFSILVPYDLHAAP